MAINFFNEDIDFPKPFEKIATKNWIKKVVTLHSMRVGDINYIFTSDQYLLAINKEHLQHDYYTDVITFDYSETNTIAGDIYISLDTVATNADEFKQTFSDELNRVIIHGVLHLIGFKDKSKTDSLEMRKQENKALELR